MHFPGITVEFRRLGQCFLDWATAVVSEADSEMTGVTLTYHTIYETLAQTSDSGSYVTLDGRS